MKAIKMAVLTSILLCGSGTFCHALVAYTTFNFQFEAAAGETTVFDGSTITIGIPSVSIPDRVLGFDIKDPNVPGGAAMIPAGGPDILLASQNISSVSAAGWFGSFTIDYLDALSRPETITVVGNGSIGSITDSDPQMADGTWVAVPDQAGSLLLLALASAGLWGMRSLEIPAGRRLPVA
jgi:hypothetical protein